MDFYLFIGFLDLTVPILLLPFFFDENKYMKKCNTFLIHWAKEFWSYLKEQLEQFYLVYIVFLFEACKKQAGSLIPIVLIITVLLFCPEELIKSSIKWTLVGVLSSIFASTVFLSAYRMYLYRDRLEYNLSEIHMILYIMLGKISMYHIYSTGIKFANENFPNNNQNKIINPNIVKNLKKEINKDKNTESLQTNRESFFKNLYTNLMTTK